MATTAATTLEELARMPEDGLRHEIDAGELLVMTRPNSRHGILQANLIRILGDYVHRTGLGRIMTESGFILSRHPETLRGPDVAFVGPHCGIRRCRLLSRCLAEFKLAVGDIFE